MRPKTISIIIPVYNEHDRIAETLSHLAGLGNEVCFEIIVADGHPQGTTLARIHREAVIKVRSAKGRAAQMNSGAATARGDILLFLHADTLLPPNAFELIAAACANSEKAAGAFTFQIGSARRIYRLIEKAVAVRNRLTRIPYGDQAIFIQAGFFRQLGGYAPIPLMEDIELMRRVKKAGGEITILPKAIETSPRRWEKEGVVYCTLRNWLLAGLYLTGVPPRYLERFYR